MTVFPAWQSWGTQRLEEKKKRQKCPKRNWGLIEKTMAYIDRDCENRPERTDAEKAKNEIEGTRHMQGRELKLQVFLFSFNQKKTIVSLLNTTDAEPMQIARLSYMSSLFDNAFYSVRFVIQKWALTQNGKNLLYSCKSPLKLLDTVSSFHQIQIKVALIKTLIGCVFTRSCMHELSVSSGGVIKRILSGGHTLRPVVSLFTSRLLKETMYEQPDLSGRKKRRHIFLPQNFLQSKSYSTTAWHECALPEWLPVISSFFSKRKQPGTSKLRDPAAACETGIV